MNEGATYVKAVWFYYTCYVHHLLFIAQTATCLTADPGVASLIPARPHTFAEIDHEIISTAILLPSTDSRRVVVSHKWKYVYEILVNCLV